MSNKRISSFFTIIGILIIAGLIFAGLMFFRPTPPRTERPRVVPLVTTVLPESRSGALTITGNGTVRPTREINLVAEVAGKITSISVSAVSGGFFQRGETLFRVDPSDYENAVAIAEAEVTQRRYELLLAREEVTIAKDEWERLQGRLGRAEEPAETELGSLVLKEPQLKLAEALLKSAEARLADAQTRLRRTAIGAPFIGRVRAKQVDIGQYVSPGQAVATVYNTDEVEIVVPLQSGEAALISDLWNRDTGRSVVIPARVHTTFGEARYEWDGYVDRTEGALDPTTRTVNVVVRVRQPYDAGDIGRPPLLVGMFTSVEIDGATLDAYSVIPRAALKEGSNVWLFQDGQLQIQSVDVIQEDDGLVYLRGEFDADVPLIVSNLEVFTNGMEVRAQ